MLEKDLTLSDIQKLMDFKINIIHKHDKGNSVIRLNYYDNNILVKDFLEKIVPKYRISELNRFNISTVLNLNDDDAKLFFIERQKIYNHVDLATK